MLTDFDVYQAKLRGRVGPFGAYPWPIYLLPILGNVIGVGFSAPSGGAFPPQSGRVAPSQKKYKIKIVEVIVSGSECPRMLVVL